MIINVDLYGQIRHMHTREGIGQRDIASRLGISRNTVIKYCDGNQVPWERKPYERPTTRVTEDVKCFIQECLEQDQQEGLNKQRHTARRL